MTALTFDHQSQTSGRHYRLTPVLNTRNATGFDLIPQDSVQFPRQFHEITRRPTEPPADRTRNKAKELLEEFGTSGLNIRTIDNTGRERQYSLDEI